MPENKDVKSEKDEPVPSEKEYEKQEINPDSYKDIKLLEEEERKRLIKEDFKFIEYIGVILGIVFIVVMLMVLIKGSLK